MAYLYQRWARIRREFPRLWKNYLYQSFLATVIIFSLAVGISICLMVALDAMHPPVSGTALGVAITGFSPSVMIAVLTSSLVLSLVHHFSKRFLKDLT